MLTSFFASFLPPLIHLISLDYELCAGYCMKVFLMSPWTIPSCLENPSTWTEMYMNNSHCLGSANTGYYEFQNKPHTEVTQCLLVLRAVCWPHVPVEVCYRRQHQDRTSFIDQIKSSEFLLSPAHLNKPTYEVFYTVDGYPPCWDHCPPHFIIPWDSQLHVIRHHHLLACCGRSISHFITSHILCELLGLPQTLSIHALFPS